MKRSRIIIFISALLMLCLAWSVSADTEENIDQLSYSVLCDIGVYTDENGDYDLGRSITRGEFAGIAVRLTGINIPDVENVAFADVPSDHKFFDSIYYAVSRGILKGNENGLFRPDENITYEEMIAAVIRILGYEPVIKLNGVYPDAYISKAYELGLLDGVEGSINGDMTFESMTRMIYNALDVDCCTEVGGSRPGYQIEEGNNLLWQSFRIKKERGIVTGNNTTRLANPKAMPENTIEIDDQEFVCTRNDAYGLLGYSVEYYYKDSSDDRILIHIHSILDTELIMEADRIKSVNNNEYEYYVVDSSSSTKRVKFSKEADFIYNSKAVSNTDGILLPSSGEVRLIDNDFDGIYDVVFIDEYINIIIGSINWDKYIVYDKYDSSKKIELRSGGEYSDVSVIDRSGMNIPFDELREWDVLSVAATPEGGGYVKAVVNYGEINGIVTSIGSDSKGRTTYTIDGQEYCVAADIPEAAKPENILNKQVTAGRDCFGKIAYIKTDSSGLDDMGYLMDAVGYIEDSGDDSLLVKIFSLNGEMLVLNGADKVNVDGNNVDKAEVINYLTDENGVKNGMLAYKTNSDGELSVIDTAYGYNESPSGRESVNSIHILYPKSNLRYKRNMKSFGGKLCISNDTLFLYVPADKTAERQYRLLDSSYFVNDNDYNVEAYAIDSESLSADILIVHGSGSEAIDASTAPILVQKKYTAVNEDNDIVHCISGYSFDADKGYQEIYAIDDKLLSDVEPGDVIRCGLDSIGNIEKIEWVYDLSRDRFGEYADPVNEDIQPSRFGSIGNFTDQYRMIFGAVYKKNGDYMSVTIDDTYSDSSEKEVFPISGFKIYKVESDGSNVYITEADGSEITDYISTMRTDVSIMMYTRYAEPESIVIYENN